MKADEGASWNRLQNIMRLLRQYTRKRDEKITAKEYDLVKGSQRATAEEIQEAYKRILRSRGLIS